MRVLGLDPSLRQFGWAVYNSEIKSCECKGRFKTSSKDLFVDRYVQLREDLRLLIQQTKPNYIGIEYPVFRSLYSEGMYGLFLYSCEALKSEFCDVVFFSPLQVKAHARNYLQRPKGWSMDKADMVEAVKLHSGDKTRWNHNEADAYWVAYAAYRFWELYESGWDEEKLSLNEVEQSQFLNIKKYVRGKKKGKVEKKGIAFREDDRFFLWSKLNGEEK